MESIEYKVVDMQGRPAGTVALDKRVFEAPIQEHLVHEVVVLQRNKKRSGTHNALTRTEMEGGGRKPWKQKGTGRARSGSNISPLWVGGAVTFGPSPRDYTTRVSKRTRRQALASVLTDKVKNETLVVIDALSLSDIKTKEIATVLKNVGASDARTVILVNGQEGDVVIEKSSRNIKGVKTLGVQGVNVYDLLNHKYLVCTKEGVQSLQQRLTGEDA